jgi:hypothetical protein
VPLGEKPLGVAARTGFLPPLSPFAIRPANPPDTAALPAFKDSASWKHALALLPDSRLYKSGTSTCAESLADLLFRGRSSGDVASESQPASVVTICETAVDCGTTTRCRLAPPVASSTVDQVSQPDGALASHSFRVVRTSKLAHFFNRDENARSDSTGGQSLTGNQVIHTADADGEHLRSLFAADKQFCIGYQLCPGWRL